jgi:hypothetical protein
MQLRMTSKAETDASPSGLAGCTLSCLLALTFLSSAFGVAIAWIFSLFGTADLFNAFYQANHPGLLAGQLGAAFFFPTLIVPLLLITHGLGFRILLQHENESATSEGQRTAQRTNVALTSRHTP